MGTSNESKSRSEIHGLQEFVSQELFGGVRREVQDVEAGVSYRQPLTVRAAIHPLDEDLHALETFHRDAVCPCEKH